MKLKLFVGMVVLAFAVQTPVQAQGIPVVDMANLEQALQNIAAWQRQLQAMQQQYEQQVSQFFFEIFRISGLIKNIDPADHL